MLKSPGPESAGQDLRDRNYIARALSGKQNWSELFYSDIENRNLMILSTPIYSPKNPDVPIGTANLEFNQDKINSIMKKSVLKNTMMYVNLRPT